MAKDMIRKVLFFAQVDRFSYTNDALLESLQKNLSNIEVKSFRVFPYICKNPFYLSLCVSAVVAKTGFRALKSKKMLGENIIKTKTFFRLSSRIVRGKIKETPNVVAVLQTQGLFNAHVENIPLVLYTDNTLLNVIHKASGSPHPLEDLERELYQDVDGFAVSATHVRTSLMDDYGVAGDRIEVVHIGANVPTSAVVAPDRFSAQKLLFVGIDWERKGGPTLIRAFERIAKSFPQATLTIAGCSPQADHPRIRVLGRIPPQAVADLMAASTIFCLPSRVEPSSVAAIEAASFGLPIIATRVGGFLDSVGDGTTGLLVPPDDDEALSAAMETLLKQPELCAELGRAGQAQAKDVFNWNAITRRIAAMVERLTA